MHGRRLDSHEEENVSHYEFIWIAAPTLSPEEFDSLSQGFQATLKEKGAEERILGEKEARLQGA